MKDDMISLAIGSVLRAAINADNRALVQRDGDHLLGVSRVLAPRLRDESGADSHIITCDGV